MLNLDTHILLAAVDGKLRPSEEALLRDDFWSFADIVLWEIAWLHRESRISISLDHPGLSRAIRDATVWPVSREVGKALALLDFRSDPADELVAATSIAHDIPLLTRDMRILGSKVVPLALR